MKNNKIISIIFYIISILFLLYYGFIELSSNMFLSEFGRLFLLCGSCLFLYLGAFFLSKHIKSNKPMKINLWIFFILYLILLTTLTLFDPMWGRNGINILDWNKETFNNYINNSFNIIPFKTIIDYIKDIFTSLLDTKTIFFNLFGNLVCLMPLALFLPILFKKINNTKRFLISIVSISLTIEVIQFITITGSCDIDDLILNTIGALIMCKILNIKDLNNLLRNIFLLENNKIDKKKILLVSIPIFIAVILFSILYKIGTKYYNNNLDNRISKRNYKLEIIDETKNCDTSLELFYETELYNYYFDCIKSDYVYAKINDQDKYLVKDLLNNNPTEYIISIDKFERAGLDFIKEEKYQKIILNLESDVYLDTYKIADENIFKIGWGKSTVGKNINIQEVFLIPKKTGETTIYFNINDSKTGELTNVIEYKIIINSNLEITYHQNN